MQDQIRGYLPRSHSTLRHGMAGIEIVTDPFGVERLNHGCHVPHRRSDVLLVVVISDLNSVTTAKIGKSSKFPSRLFQLAANINEIVHVITRLEKGNGQPCGGGKDGQRRRVVSRSQRGITFTILVVFAASWEK